jgi:hypothetical protein
VKANSEVSELSNKGIAVLQAGSLPAGFIREGSEFELAGIGGRREGNEEVTFGL